MADVGIKPKQQQQRRRRLWLNSKLVLRSLEQKVRSFSGLNLTPSIALRSFVFSIHLVSEEMIMRMRTGNWFLFSCIGFSTIIQHPCPPPGLSFRHTSSKLYSNWLLIMMPKFLSGSLPPNSPHSGHSFPAHLLLTLQQLVTDNDTKVYSRHPSSKLSCNWLLVMIPKFLFILILTKG